MDKLQWFKFTPTDWIMGKIQKCPEITQARFMRLLCLYWNKECVLSLEDAEIEIDKDHLDILISKKVLKIIDDLLVIDFLNEQLESISETSLKRKEAVLKRWNKVKQIDTSVLQTNTSVLQIDTEKRREREDKSMYKSFSHLSISINDVDKLKTDYTIIQIDNVLESIENYKKNTNYKSLYLTAKKWLEKEYSKKSERTTSKNTLGV